MSPSSLDFELRSMDITNDFDLLRKLLTAISVQMDSNRDFELLQAYLAVVLKIHGDLMVANPESFQVLLTSLLGKQRTKWSTLEELFQQTLCLTDFVRHAV